MITLDGIQLPDQLVWDDEFAWSPANQQITLTLTGAQFIQESAASGRPISLLHTDKAWITRAALSQLKAKEAQLGLQMTLTMHDGRRFLVMFKRDPNGVEADPVVEYADPDDADLYTVSLYFTVLEELS